MISLKLKLIGGFALAVLVFFTARWIVTLPESWREDGRVEERTKAKQTSDDAVAKRDLEFEDIKSSLKAERENHEKSKTALDAKFNQYVADVRSGRIAGLRIARSGLCPARTEEAPSSSGVVEEASVRLPATIEEGLFRFAHDRDQIIADFESFKTEVRLAKCFAEN